MTDQEYVISKYPIAKIFAAGFGRAQKFTVEIGEAQHLCSWRNTVADAWAATRKKLESRISIQEGSVMKLQLQVGHVYQRAGKPKDRDKPMPVFWDVLLFTEPHMGDINLESSDPDFARWAKTLNVNEIIEVEFGKAKPIQKD